MCTVSTRTTLPDVEIVLREDQFIALRYADGKRLSLFVQPNGSKLWRFRYRFGGKASMLALGTWPKASIVKASDARDEARARFRSGVNPSEARRTVRADRRTLAKFTSSDDSFERIAREWLDKQTKRLSPRTLAKAEWILSTHAYPYIGAHTIGTIEPPDVLAMLQTIEAEGKIETAHRTKSRCSQIFRYAIATGRATRDPTLDLRDALSQSL